LRVDRAELEIITPYSSANCLLDEAGRVMNDGPLFVKTTTDTQSKMGQPHRVTFKRKRRKAYLKRKKQEAKAKK